MRIVTIGVYGFEAETFRAAVARSGIDLFVDTRRRRGVRGSQYAFANSQRLQALLAGLGIPYVHRIDLAAPEAALKGQDAADRAAGIARHDRDRLTDAFREMYQRDVLDVLDSQALMAGLGNPGAPLFFCVEGNPAACHRSLLAAHLARDLGGTVEHIIT
jgi:uncharacterized protein (DUF488 family)